jgi:hypothetical protein
MNILLARNRAMALNFGLRLIKSDIDRLCRDGEAISITESMTKFGNALLWVQKFSQN